MLMIIIIQNYFQFFSIITSFVCGISIVLNDYFLRSIDLHTSCMYWIIYIPVLFYKISEVAYKKNNKTA